MGWLTFQSCLFAVIMFLISWAFTVVSLALASLIYYYVSIKGKAGDWGDGVKSAYFQLALRSLRSLGGLCPYANKDGVHMASEYSFMAFLDCHFIFCGHI